MAEWEAPGFGFAYPSGASIYDKVKAAGLQWRIYADENGPILGSIPQVSALKGVMYKIDTNAFSTFAADVQGPYPYAYTFIEPNYGDTSSGTYMGGSSQHPMDSPAGGEGLIKATYEALRNSPLWERSLLIITYDEHGGFYDSVQTRPRYAARRWEPPGPQEERRRLHVRPLRHPGARGDRLAADPQGSVDHTLYDHASVSATLNRARFRRHDDRSGQGRPTSFRCFR